MVPWAPLLFFVLDPFWARVVQQRVNSCEMVLGWTRIVRAVNKRRWGHKKGFHQVEVI